MLRTSMRQMAIGSILFCCTTAYGQHYYPNATQPALGAAQPTQGFVPGLQPQAPSYPPMMQQPAYPPAAGSYGPAVPSQVSYPPQQQYSPQYSSAPIQTQYAAQPPMQMPPMQMPPVQLTSAAPCASGCADGGAPQGIAGYGPGGFGVATGFPQGGAVGPVPPINTSGQTSGGVGFFFRYDRLFSSINAPSGSGGDIGDPNQEGTYISNGIPTEFRNSLDTGFISDEFNFNGNRIEFGFLDGNGGCGGCGGCSTNRCGSGWVASIISIDQAYSNELTGRVDADGRPLGNVGYVLFADPTGMMLGFSTALDGEGNEVDADINGNYVYGRNGVDLGTLDPNTNLFGLPFDGVIDQPAPQDNGDLVTFIPIFNNLSARSDTSLSGLALTRFRDSRVGASRGCNGRCFKWLYGLRYFNLKDRFNVTATGGDIFEEFRISANSRNFIIGPEIGACIGRSVGPWSFSGQARVTPGINFIRSNQAATFVAAEDVTPRDAPLNTFSFASSNRNETEQFSLSAEWRGEVAYALTSFASVRAGYTGLFLGEVARSSDVTYAIPDLGLSTSRSDVYVHALTMGLEFIF